MRSCGSVFKRLMTSSTSQPFRKRNPPEAWSRSKRKSFIRSARSAMRWSTAARSLNCRRYHSGRAACGDSEAPAMIMAVTVPTDQASMAKRAGRLDCTISPLRTSGHVYAQDRGTWKVLLAALSEGPAPTPRMRRRRGPPAAPPSASAPSTSLPSRTVFSLRQRCGSPRACRKLTPASRSPMRPTRSASAMARSPSRGQSSKDSRRTPNSEKT
mmetsp:Transcript_13648/g.40256  ORF Transcript_13648/g.40256 Transcript_13648/m.40256 type:complete len:213 (-) Transcript_13648:131-769(-)